MKIVDSSVYSDGGGIWRFAVTIEFSQGEVERIVKSSLSSILWVDSNANTNESKTE